MNQVERLKELQAAAESVDRVIARMLNERTRIACETLALTNAVGIVDATDPEAEVLTPTLVAIAEEGHLGKEGMTHLFRQIRNQVRVTQIQTIREWQRQSLEGQAASA